MTKKGSEEQNMTNEGSTYKIKQVITKRRTQTMKAKMGDSALNLHSQSRTLCLNFALQTVEAK